MKLTTEEAQALVAFHAGKMRHLVDRAPDLSYDDQKLNAKMMRAELDRIEEINLYQQGETDGGTG